MDFKKWIDLWGSTTGKTLASALTVYFLYFEVWPLIKKHLEQKRLDRKEQFEKELAQRKEEMDSLKKLIDSGNNLHETSLGKMIKAMEDQRDAIRGLKEELIRNQRK